MVDAAMETKLLLRASQQIVSQSVHNQMSCITTAKFC